MIASTGAKFWRRFRLSVLALVIFKSPIFCVRPHLERPPLRISEFQWSSKPLLVRALHTKPKPPRASLRVGAVVDTSDGYGCFDFTCNTPRVRRSLGKAAQGTGYGFSYPRNVAKRGKTELLGKHNRTSQKFLCALFQGVAMSCDRLKESSLGSHRSGRGAKSRPRLKKSKKSLRGSLRGVPADPPTRVKNESPGNPVSQKAPGFDSGDSVLTQCVGLGRLPQRLARRLFFYFLSWGRF